MFCGVDGKGPEAVVMGAMRAMVQKVCRLTRDEDDTRRILDYVWSESEGSAGILEELEEGNEDLHRFEKMLEAQ